MGKIKMKYFEILYSNCFDKKYVALQCTEDNKPNVPKFNGCKLIECKETTFEAYRNNIIKFFKDYGFSVS